MCIQRVCKIPKTNFPMLFPGFSPLPHLRGSLSSSLLHIYLDVKPHSSPFLTRMPATLGIFVTLSYEERTPITCAGMAFITKQDLWPKHIVPSVTPSKGNTLETAVSYLPPLSSKPPGISENTSFPSLLQQ